MAYRSIPLADTVADIANKRIEQLTDQLDNLRLHFIYMATQRSPKPHEAHGLLIRSVFDLRGKPDSDLWRWERAAIDGMLEIAEVENGLAHCPLCAEGVDDWYAKKERGFRWPLGLEMHLTGQGRASKCIVMQTAFEWARDQASKKK
jgi:hypothetical protein